MNKRSLIALIVTVICIINFSTVTFAEPNTSTQQNIQENMIIYQQLDDETLELNAKIAKLNNEIENINLQLQENDNEIENTKIEIDTINKKIETSKVEIEKRQLIMDKRVRSMYKSNMAFDMITYLITSDDIFDFFYRIDSMQTLLSIDNEILAEINEKKNELTEDIESVTNKKNDLENLKVSIEKSLTEVNKKKEDLEISLSELNSKKDELMAIIEENELSLISYSLSIINSNSNSIDTINDAITNLSYMLPQLNTNNAISLAEEGISSGNSHISTIKANIATEKAKKESPKKEMVLEEGTESVSNNNDSNSNYLSTYSMVATAYTGGTYTAMGMKPVRNPNGLSTIAVDPSVIPLGSKVYVEGYGYAIASDTGGAIKGKKIDLYMNSVKECFSFGRRNVTLHLIAYPNQW